ncbi:MAG: hypothetical protein ACRET8_10400 [Burkholderiales bacterium]
MRGFAYALLLVAAALIVQRWYGWDAGHALGGTDAESYEAIARAAPGHPQEKLPFHHAQRWVGPYLVGLAARHWGVDVRALFLVASASCLLVAVLLLQASFARLALSPVVLVLCLAMYVLHFSLRFYLIAPGMLPDALFIAGLAVLLLGLASDRWWLLLAGLFVAAIGRQTALLLLPGIVVWLSRGERWLGRACTAAIVAGLVYGITGQMALTFAEPSENLQSLTGLFAWLAGPEFTPAELLVFASYAAVPLLVPGSALCALWWLVPQARDALWHSREIQGCLLMAAAIVSQPLLGGPDFTGPGNGTRLAALALGPLCLAVGLSMRAAQLAPSSGTLAGLVLMLWMGSLHYNYTLIGPHSIELFAFLQLAIAVLGAWRLARAPAGGKTA